MLLQHLNVNTLLHNMRAQILKLTTQLAKLQENPPEATSEQKFSKKVKIIADPGAFEGDWARFAKWWVKLQIWIKVNWDVFADDFEIATAVLSRLKGPVAGRYTQVRLQECYTTGVWPTWDDLKVEIKKYFKPQAERDWAHQQIFEIKKYFKPQAERDWAHQQICTFKQGNMRTDDFVTRFLALSIQGASLLERGPGETNTMVLDSGKYKNKNIENPKIEKHVSFDTSSSSSLEPLSSEIPRRVLMCTYLFQKEIRLDVGVENLARGIVHPTSTLLDSGANSIFIDQVWAEQIGLPLVKLDVSIPVYNIDGTLNAMSCTKVDW
ncbi:hypothetical protein SERLA73DRAFT_78442 [Serpula lacrymans var. lacrymans S7.3]|uniref:Retrotransposon gag domain-containing protein n=2 Tax=Serpula lacrymans var. lacrymans TaxID=341189 RepID=F8QD84_SERL3|nr:uncharacterized protein SERLADRAFT_443478 [Serpula lacrymans var. lacrymans S7.9]EGN93555.1 hypothetical protein SERLA73DRAFT_78442 [Serpula lacrymans var. lacrymans S7.3]EGO18930.1 hypothetical protein SERLADRAFT_443478 [Serpula lacrymans var. lacrymans S7.9]